MSQRRFIIKAAVPSHLNKDASHGGQGTADPKEACLFQVMINLVITALLLGAASERYVGTLSRDRWCSGARTYASA